MSNINYHTDYVDRFRIRLSRSQAMKDDQTKSNFFFRFRVPMRIKRHLNVKSLKWYSRKTVNEGVLIMSTMNWFWLAPTNGFYFS